MAEFGHAQKSQKYLEDHTISKKDLLTRVSKHWDEAPIIEASQKLVVFSCKRFSHLESGLKPTFRVTLLESSVWQFLPSDNDFTSANRFFTIHLVFPAHKKR